MPALLFSSSLYLELVFWSLPLILLSQKPFLWQRLHRFKALKQHWVWNISSSAPRGERKLSRGHCGGIKERYNWRHFQKCCEFNRLGGKLAPCFLVTSHHLSPLSVAVCHVILVIKGTSPCLSWVGVFSIVCLKQILAMLRLL